MEKNQPFASYFRFFFSEFKIIIRFLLNKLGPIMSDFCRFLLIFDSSFSDFQVSLAHST